MTEKTVPKVSVLVPIYNVEKYLRQCLESLVNQTLQEIEIICINDGSSDNSLAIVKEFADRDKRIEIIDKKNSGYGDSMNQGLKKAHGEYIGIVESDDFVDLDAFEKLYNIAATYDVEVVRANYYRNTNNQDEKFLYIDPADAGRVMDPTRNTWIFYQPPSIWSAIYRREFLNKSEIRFLPTAGASYQDTAFNFKIWASAHRAYFTTECFLHYRLDNDASSVNNPGKIFNVCYEYEEIEKYLRERGLISSLGQIMETAKFGAYYWNMKRLAAKLLPEFMRRTKEEFSKAQAEGLIARELFEDKSQWKFLQFLLGHSIFSAIIYLQFQKLRMGIHEAFKGLWRFTHPSYRKQEELSELIIEAYAEIDLLQTKLLQLQEKKDL